MTNSSTTPFTIDIPQEQLDDLAYRLEHTRFPHPLPADGWETGVPLDYLRFLVAEWRRFDWRATEARLNRLPQVRTEIDGQTVHAIHVVSPVPDATPLLLTHGWPGSFLELEHLIGPLSDPEAHGGDPADAFSVVIASVPGFGFSTPLADGPWTTERVARIWLELMTRLGHERFVVQGGDFGAAVAPAVARVAPHRVLGVHVNGALGGFVDSSDAAALEDLSEVERDRLRRVDEFMQREFGYIAIQSTRPGLIGVMFAESPLAQLAWMVDKLAAWTHPIETLPDRVLGIEFVLANATLAWLTASAGSSALVTYAQPVEWGVVPENSGVPTAAIQFAHDVGIRSQAERSHTIVRGTDVNDRGGHFAALEEPDLLISDLREFVRSLR